MRPGVTPPKNRWPGGKIWPRSSEGAAITAGRRRRPRRRANGPGGCPGRSKRSSARRRAAAGRRAGRCAGLVGLVRLLRHRAGRRRARVVLGLRSVLALLRDEARAALRLVLPLLAEVLDEAVERLLLVLGGEQLLDRLL